MAFDFKKEYKDLYLPKAKPTLIDVPAMSFLAVAGAGNPNDENGSYAEAVALLYGISFTVKMAKMGSWQPEGYFDYVVPPLEGLWFGEGTFDGRRIVDKDAFQWVSLIRQPDFVTPDVFTWATGEVSKKKPNLDTTRIKLVRFAEGTCAQVMHHGPYDDEPATVEALGAFIHKQGSVEDITEPASAEALMNALDAQGGIPSLRLHHEIYLGDPRRTRPENLKTVIRHPVRSA